MLPHKAFCVNLLAFLLLVGQFDIQVESKSVKTEAGINEQNQCSNEQHRPRFHFSPARNWINDPNGMVYYDGVYHLFYQYHPFSTVWGPMYWGHTISSDLSKWQELEPALEPDNLGTIFSGSAVVDYDNTTGFQTDSNVHPIVAIYTSAGEKQAQSIAYSIDKGFNFQKYEGNPVLPNPGINDFRDPKVTKVGNQWVMTLAVGNRVEFYGSGDLKEWRKLSEFGGNPEEGAHGGVWECPDLIPMNFESTQVWVLLVSINPGGPNRGSATQYFIGNFDGATFTSSNQWEDTQWLDWGPDNYAGVSFSNEPQGRVIYIGWMNNWMYADRLPTESWRGQMTIPRQIQVERVNGGARLISSPVPELETLRNWSEHLERAEEFIVEPQHVVELTDHQIFRNPTMEMEIVLEISGEPRFSLCAYNSIGEEVCFGYNETRWYLDRSKSGNTGFSQDFSAIARAQRVNPQNEIHIRMFLDMSSIEVFADGGVTTMTALFYPSQPLDQMYVNHWSPEGSQGTVKVKYVNIWGLHCFD